MARIRTALAYDGPALESGVMDVRDLAPALLSLGQLFEHANRVLNGNRAQVTVHVRAGFKRGSFGVSIEVVQGLIEQLQQILIGDRVTATLALAALLGLAKGHAVSLFKLLKWLRGRRPTSLTVVRKGVVRLEVEGGDHLDVVEAVLRLYNDPEVRKAAGGVVAPVEREGITRLEIRGPRKTVIESVTRDDLAGFGLGPIGERDLGESEIEGVYTIVKLSFEERFKWTFTDGNATFNADIEDGAFFEQVQSRKITFTSGDLLRIRLSRKNWQTEKGLRTEYRVRKVLEHIPALKQIPLTLPPPSEF